MLEKKTRFVNHNTIIIIINNNHKNAIRRSEGIFRSYLFPVTSLCEINAAAAARRIRCNRGRESPSAAQSGKNEGKNIAGATRCCDTGLGLFILPLHPSRV